VTADIIEFPGKRRDPKTLLAELTEAVEAGEVEHMLVVTMGKDTSVHVGMTTSPTHCLIYMNHYQLLKMHALMRAAGMIE
jgi:hypothetical protein